jgi:metal-responsive CopG/Arc/MetJ family transcriptional regulator
MGFFDSLIDQRQREQFTEGLEAYVRLYYNEYTDAVEIDGTVWRALETLTQMSNFDVIEETVPELVSRVQKAITSETGRHFKEIETDD